MNRSFKRSIFFVFPVLFFFLTNPPLSFGKTLTVPKDYNTIQAAIDAAEEGDEVIVSPGTYTESIILNKSGITLQGTDSQTILTVSDGSSVIEVTGISSIPTVIKGFQITAPGIWNGILVDPDGIH